ncbi:unnamed protein product [Ectocarpus sp. CCAP 1310/34]|nr:unnamed protein product [Ectocarpus sp. CCAP 1310/34]
MWIEPGCTRSRERGGRERRDNGDDGCGWLRTYFWVWLVLELEYFLVVSSSNLLVQCDGTYLKHTRHM